ncbi:MAG: hypothetical protein HWE30_17330 [Methylocystaceae bacterium]|nr:hypothetical protein [Methylocystaceae bacterium]
MKKIIFSLLALGFLSACQTTGTLKSGEVMGTDIGSILSDEANLSLGRSDEEKMNTEIDKALYFSENGLTTQWYAAYSTRLRPIGPVRDRRDRECRRFRHGVMIEGRWQNGTAIACREHNVPWYLIANRWDQNFTRDRGHDRPIHGRDGYRNRGNWENLSDELKGNPSNQSFDDFGPRNTKSW